MRACVKEQDHVYAAGAGRDAVLRGERAREREREGRVRAVQLVGRYMYWCVATARRSGEQRNARRATHICIVVLVRRQAALLVRGGPLGSANGTNEFRFRFRRRYRCRRHGPDYDCQHDDNSSNREVCQGDGADD